MYRRLSVNATIRASLRIADVEKSLELRKKLETHADKEPLERSLSWFRKARDENDVVNGFVMRWIAFNSLYGIFNPNKKSDMTAIKNLINAHPSTEKIREILAKYDGAIKNLISKELKDWHGRKNYSNKLKGLIVKQRRQKHNDGSLPVSIYSEKGNLSWRHYASSGVGVY